MDLLGAFMPLRIVFGIEFAVESRHDLLILLSYKFIRSHNKKMRQLSIIYCSNRDMAWANYGGIPSTNVMAEE